MPLQYEAAPSGLRLKSEEGECPRQGYRISLQRAASAASRPLQAIPQGVSVKRIATICTQAIYEASAWLKFGCAGTRCRLLPGLGSPHTGLGQGHLLFRVLAQPRGQHAAGAAGSHDGQIDMPRHDHHPFHIECEPRPGDGIVRDSNWTCKAKARSSATPFLLCWLMHFSSPTGPEARSGAFALRLQLANTSSTMLPIALFLYETMF